MNTNIINVNFQVDNNLLSFQKPPQIHLNFIINIDGYIHLRSCEKKIRKKTNKIIDEEELNNQIKVSLR